MDVEEPSFNSDLGYDDSYFDRPRFSLSSQDAVTCKKSPLILSPEGETPVVKVPSILNVHLRDYQREGIQFLYGHYREGSGALLCDDMGLGKTVQVVAMMVAVLQKTCTKNDVLLAGPYESHDLGTFLVVCPGSVLYNWVEEVETWSHLKCGVYHKDKKGLVLDRAMRRRYDVVITTHETAKLHVDNLNNMKWLAVFMDEAHHLKDPKSLLCLAISKLQVKPRFALTGTLMQNKLKELWVLLNWVNPNCLGGLKSFQDKFEKPILQAQKFDCTKRELATGRLTQEQLSSLLSTWVLRRTSEVLATQLPKKEEFVVFCPLTELQRSVYQAILDTDDIQLIVQSDLTCDCGSGMKRGDCCYTSNSEGTPWSRLVNEHLVLLIKCANHVGLLYQPNSESVRKSLLTKTQKVCRTVFNKYPQLLEMSCKASLITLSDPDYCGKIKTLNILLERFSEEKSKVLIFSLSVQLLNIIEEHLIGCNHSYLRLDGKTKVEDRVELVHRFNSSPNIFVFLISKKCGGVGLNVTGANRVILFDPSWNPAVDRQAEDRVFRIGQHRDVQVFRLISEGTIEEMMYLREVYKQQIGNTVVERSKERRYFTGVAGDKHQQGELFGCQNLFQLRNEGSSLSYDLMKRSEMMEGGVKMAKNDLTNRTKESTSSSEWSWLLNKSLVGASKVEEHITEQAISDVQGLQLYSQEPANYVSKKLIVDEVSEESDDVCDEASVGDDSEVEVTTKPATLPDDGSREIRHRHFGEMATTLGYNSSGELAEIVVASDQKERKKLLRKFYSKRKPPTSSTVKKRKMAKKLPQIPDHLEYNDPSEESAPPQQDHPDVSDDITVASHDPVVTSHEASCDPDGETHAPSITNQSEETMATLHDHLDDKYITDNSLDHLDDKHITDSTPDPLATVESVDIDELFGI